MDQIQSSYAAARQNPVKAGLFAVLGVVAIGVAAGFALGYNAPAKTWAMVSPVIVTPPPPPPPPVIITPVVPIVTPPPVSPVVINPVAPTKEETTPAPSTETPNVVSPVTVTPSTDSDDHGDPCCTDTPTTDVPDTDTHGDPCCTETPPTDTPVTPPVIVTPPVVPAVVTNDLCPNRPDLDKNNLPDGYFVDDNGNCVQRTTTAVLECVFLRGTPQVIEAGQAVTLEWQTKNATSITIDNGVGSVTPVAAGTKVVNPTQTTTYMATVTGASGTVNCQTTVTVKPSVDEHPAQCVFLNGTPSVINAGDPVRLEWQTKDATSITIDNGIGQVLPTESGFRIVNPTQTTTYKATVTGATGSVNCQTTVTVTTIQQGPQCVSLTADRARIQSGEAVTLSWVISKATSVVLDNGIGTKTGETGSVVVNPTSNTTYTAKVPGAPDNANCKVDVVIETTGCTSNCGGGGGGGGGRRSARVGLESFVPDLEEPLSFVYLSEVPYTGLELGTWGTVLYWTMLIGWSLALAYLVLFNAVPFALSRVKSFGGSVKEALNSDAHGADSHGSHDSHAAPVAHAAHAPAAHGHGHAPAHAAPAAPAKPQGYNAHDGFRSFAAGEGLTIDDIVKGLSREIEQKHEVHAAPVAVPTHEEVMQAVHEEAPAPAPAYVPAPAAPVYQAPKPAAHAAMAPMNADVRDFVAALLNGDRDTVFGMIRSMARQGQDTEAFVSHAACALDDAYRACIDGTTCHPDIAELTNGCHPSYLERLVSSLTTAVDGSYSAGMTGVKMALTRALGVVAG